MKARAVCLPTGKPLPIFRLSVFVVLSLAAMLLLSCANTDSKPAAKHASPALSATDEISNSTDVIPIKSLEELTKVYSGQIQRFTVKTTRDTTIVGAKGVKVSIPADCFDSPDNKTVQIELKEYNSAADFFYANLTTTSNGKLLESGGTIYINATVDGIPVTMKDGKEIALAFPTGRAKPKEDMQTFYGEQAANGSINWQQSNSFDDNNYKYNRMLWSWKMVPHIVNEVLPSSLTTAKYRVQISSQDKKCPVFEDTTFFTNALEYLDNRLNIPTKDLESLKGSGVHFVVYYNKFGNATKVRLDKEAFNPKYKPNIKARRDAINRLNADITKIIYAMPAIDTKLILERRHMMCYGYNNSAKDTIRNKGFYKVMLLFADYSDCEDFKEVHINPVKEIQITDREYVFDEAKADSLMKNDAYYYSLKTKKLGWINCDKFYGENVAKKNVSITTPGFTKTMEVRVIFKDIFSAINAGKTDAPSAYALANVPANSSIKVIAIDKRIDGIYFAVKDANTNEAEIPLVDFKPMTVEAIKKELDSI